MGPEGRGRPGVGPMILKQFRKRRLLKRTFTSLILINMASLFILTWFETTTFRKFFFEQTAAGLESSALILENQIRPMLRDGKHLEIDVLCKELRYKNRITVVLPSGKVVGDSLNDPETMTPHDQREEILSATRFGTGKSVRYSETLSKQMMYYALSINENRDMLGVVRVSRPDAVHKRSRSEQWEAASGCLSWLGHRGR